MRISVIEYCQDNRRILHRADGTFQLQFLKRPGYQHCQKAHNGDQKQRSDPLEHVELLDESGNIIQHAARSDQGLVKESVAADKTRNLICPSENMVHQTQINIHAEKQIDKQKQQTASDDLAIFINVCF